KAAAPSGRAPGSPVGLWGRGGEQARLKASVVEEDTEEWQKDPDFSGLQRVGGVDLSYVKGDESRACASLVVLSFPALELGCPGCRILGKVFSLWSWWGGRGTVRAVLGHPFPFPGEQGCGAGSSQSPVVCAGHCQSHTAAALGADTGRKRGAKRDSSFPQKDGSLHPWLLLGEFSVPRK
uniref:Endonuclease V n=1 Tax=Catharus ustulatus TaxID=91951 RepID=A0A8C3U940_CATUS